MSSSLPVQGSGFLQVNSELSLITAVAKNRHISEIKALIHPATINNKLYGETALHRAVRNGSVEVVRLLVENGADPFIRTTPKPNQTSLHIAAEFGSPELIHALFLTKPLDGTLDVVKDSEDRTALYVACTKGKKENVEALLALGASVEASMCCGQPLVTLLWRENQQEICELLKRELAAVEAKKLADPPKPSFLAEIFGFELHPPEDLRSSEELVGEAMAIMKQLAAEKEGPITQELKTKCRQGVQTILAHAVRLMDRYDPSPTLHTQSIRKFARSILRDDIEGCLERCTLDWSKFPYDSGSQVTGLVRHPASMQYGLAHILDPTFIPTLYKNRPGHDYSKSLLPEFYQSGFLTAYLFGRVQYIHEKIMACEQEKDKIALMVACFKFLSLTNNSPNATVDLNCLMILQAHAILKYFANYYNFNDNYTASADDFSLYAQLQRTALALETLLKNKDCDTSQLSRHSSLSLTGRSLIDNENGCTTVYDQKPRYPQFSMQAAPLEPQAVLAIEVVPQPAVENHDWIDLPWSQLTASQQNEAKEAYSSGVDAAKKAQHPTGGQKRLVKEHDRYQALIKANTAPPTSSKVQRQLQPKPLFAQFLKSQWEHLLKNPDKLDGLYQDSVASSCPLMLLTEAPDSGLVEIERCSACVVNGYVVGAKLETHEALTTLLGNTTKLKAGEIAALIKTIHSNKQKCVVLTQKAFFAKAKTAFSQDKEATKKRSPKSPDQEQTKKDVPEALLEPSNVATGAGGEKTAKLPSAMLLPETTTYDTGDFLLDQALNTLESARFALKKREEKRMWMFAGESWPEAKLKERVNSLPQKAGFHAPILGHKLKPYQVEAVRLSREWVHKGLAGLIAADAGLGKTLICLNHIFQEVAQFHDPDRQRPVLILCKKILVNQWVAKFNEELAEVYTRIRNQLQQDTPDVWIKRLEEPSWRGAISQHNSKEIADRIDMLKKAADSFYAQLFSLFTLLVGESGKEGRNALIELFKPLKHFDVRQIFLAAQKGYDNLIADAIDAPGLQKVLATKPRVVVTTPLALEKLEGAEKMYFSWLIIDEADQVISGSDDNGNSALKKLFDAWKSRTQNRLLVTATPIRNSITDAWKLFELVNGPDENGRQFFNQLLFAKEEFLKGLASVASGKEVDMNELFATASRLHQRIRYLREILKPLTFTAHREDEAIIKQWNGRIPKVNRIITPITLSGPQNTLLERSNDITSIFKRYHFEMKVKQHPDLIEDGKCTLIDKDSDKFNEMKHLARTNPQALITKSPLWTALMQDLLGRIQKGQKSLIVCHHVIPQELLRMVISSHFAQYNVLVEAINGSSDEDVKVVLNRFKSEQKRPAVLLLINKSGGAGLDFPDAAATYMMGQEWNDASTEQIEARIVRVGVSGTKDIVYFNANLPHEKHMLETSKMKRLWADLALSLAPSVQRIVEDMQAMLSACITEFSAKVKDGALVTDAQKARLEQFLQQMMQKIEAEKLEIHEAYKACCPNWKEPSPPPPPPPPPSPPAACIPHYMPVDSGCFGLELPFRGTFSSTVQFGCLMFSRNGIHQDWLNQLIAAYKAKKAYPCDVARGWQKKHENETFDPNAMGIEVRIFKADGSSRVGFSPTNKKMTLRLIEHSDGTFSPFIKLFNGI